MLVFILMVVFSSLFVSNLLRNHLSREAENLLSQTKLKIESELIEPQTTLIVISNTIRKMIIEGSSAEAVQEFMEETGAELKKNKTAGFTFSGIFGYFEAFGGKFLHSERLESEIAYNPKERPWYTAASEAGDKIAVTPVYFNVDSNDYHVTCVHRIFNNEGGVLGVVCLDLPLENIRNYVVDMHLTKSGYGILVNELSDILSHPSLEFLGRPIAQINTDFTLLLNRLNSGSNFLESELENYLGQWIVAHTMRLDKGWALILITPKAEYYQEGQNMTVMIGTLGSFFCLILLIILVRIDRAKSKSEEENRQKGILLASMEKIREADERTEVMFNAMPFGAKLWNKNHQVIDCNQEALNLFGLSQKKDFLDNFFKLSPEYQPCGKTSYEKAYELIEKALKEGYCRFEWMHRKIDGEPIPTEITLVRVKHKEDYVVAGYIRDLREYKQMMLKIEHRDILLNTVNHAAGVLLATEDDESTNNSILNGMELLGRSVNVDRVQIWENEKIDGALHFVNRSEWTSELGKKCPPVPAGLHFPYSIHSGWEDRFLHGEYINGPLRNLPQSFQDLSDAQKVQSIVIIPLFLQDKFWGLFKLDVCSEEKTFSEEEINILRSGGLLIANAFQRSDLMQNIRSAAAELEIALKEAREANTAKSKFLATMSHEIRSPMNVILGVTESQLMGETDRQKAKDAFEKIYDSGILLLRIINDILDLSKIEAGKFELNPAKYDVLSLINDAANMNIMQYGHKQIDFKIKVDENIPLHLFGDELRIKQILNNLLSNAFKYTAGGEVALSFNAETIEENKTKLIIRVSDTGQGMTPEQINKLFDEYSRFNMDANRTTVGTGLGMTITRTLVKLMDGMMCVDSTPGKGTTFTVHIPQEITSPGVLGGEMVENIQNFRFSSKVREQNAKIAFESMPYGKVLIVDDMKSNIDVAKLLLNPYSLQIDTAESGFEAIEIIKNGNEYDIVFMDHMMPKMDGVESVKIIRENGYKHPIIALTANAITGQQEFFLANGFDGFISKPIDMRQLDNSLKKFIRDKKRSRSDISSRFINTAANTSVKEEPVPSPPLDVPDSITIPGIDTETGLALYNGSFNIYLSVLRSFVPNALSVIEKLRNVSADTLADYTVNVHGLKGISAGIGAEKVREAAFELEKLGKSGDLAGVLAGNEALLEEAGALASAIQAWLAGFDDKNRKPLLPHPDRTLLDHLRKSCEDYDMKGIDDIMDELENAEYENDTSLVPWLRERINDLDFSTAASRLSEYTR